MITHLYTILCFYNHMIIHIQQFDKDKNRQNILIMKIMRPLNICLFLFISMYLVEWDVINFGNFQDNIKPQIIKHSI